MDKEKIILHILEQEVWPYSGEKKLYLSIDDIEKYLLRLEVIYYEMDFDPDCKPRDCALDTIKTIRQDLINCSAKP